MVTTTSTAPMASKLIIFLLSIYASGVANAQSTPQPSFSTPTTLQSSTVSSNSTGTRANTTSSTTAIATSSSYPLWGPNESSNCQGSGICGFATFDSHDCLDAANEYDNNTVYYKPTSFYQNSHSLTGGCTAMYKCVSDKDYGTGLTGMELKEAFAMIYKKGKVPGYGNCKKCGSHTLANTKCYVTFNYCGNCADQNGGQGVPLPDVCPPFAVNMTRFLPWPTTSSNGDSPQQLHASALWPSVNWQFLPNVTRSAYYDPTSSNGNFLAATSGGSAAASTTQASSAPSSTPYNARVLSSPA